MTGSGPVAIIPARGGSKRLPRKNILPVQNRPMITYPLESAIQSGLFGQVIVSSEDDEILEIASEQACRTLKRPADLSRDTSTVVEVCSHVLETLNQEGSVPASFCLIYATAIFVSAKDLADSFALFDTPPLPDVVMGVSEYNLQPMQALYEDEDGFSVPRWPTQLTKQSQRHPEFYASNGTLYWARTDHFLNHPSFYTKRLKCYKIPKYRAIDIDTREDFDFAQKIAPLFLAPHQKP